MASVVSWGFGRERASRVLGALQLEGLELVALFYYCYLFFGEGFTGLKLEDASHRL